MNPNYYFTRPEHAGFQPDAGAENLTSLLNNSGRGNEILMSFLNEREYQYLSGRPPGVGQQGVDLNLPGSNFPDFDQSRQNFNSYAQIRPITKEYWAQEPLQTKFTAVKKATKTESQEDLLQAAKKGLAGAATEQKGDETPRQNSKNTYINKINSLIHEKPAAKKPDAGKGGEGFQDFKNPTLVKNESEFGGHLNAFKAGVKKALSYDSLRPEELEKVNQKLARNRESARNSRKRKKVYIELLEKKVDQLNQALNSAKKHLDENNKGNSAAAATNNKSLQEFINGKQQLYERLEKMIQAQSDETEINLLIDSLKFRLGANSKERNQAITSSYKQIQEMIYPPHMKSLLASADEHKGLFAPASGDNETKGTDGNRQAGDDNGTQSEIAEVLNLKPAQKDALSKYSNKLRQQKERFEKAAEDLQNSKKAVLKLSNAFQTTVDDLGNILTPTQIGKFLIIIDKEREKPEANEDKFELEKAKDKAGSSVGSEDSDELAEGMEHTPESSYNKNMLDFDFLKDLSTDAIRKKNHHEGEM